MTCRSFRWTTGLAGGCALFVAAIMGLSACAAPQYKYSADYSANTYFKVPYGWHQLTPDQLTSGMHGAPPAGVWVSAFDAGNPSPSDYLQSFLATSPVVFSEVFQLNSSASAGLSYNGLEDSFLPVTSAARQQLGSNTTLTGFKLIGQQTLTPGQGVHGVRVNYQYTDQLSASFQVSDTFDLVALTNAVDTEVYLLLVHCTNSCYSQNQKAINDVMTSFTVRSPG